MIRAPVEPPPPRRTRLHPAERRPSAWPQHFYEELIPEARELAANAAPDGKKAQADAVNAVIDAVLARPERAWAKGETAVRKPE